MWRSRSRTPRRPPKSTARHSGRGTGKGPAWGDLAGVGDVQCRQRFLSRGLGASKGAANMRGARLYESQISRPSRPDCGLKAKDLVGVPWRVAFALQDDGWYLRSDIIWSKPNPMPESVTDRPTKAHEYLFLLSRSKNYFYDGDAIAEPAAWERWGDQTIGPGSNPNGWIKAKTKQELTGEARPGNKGDTYSGFNDRWKKPPSWAERKAAGAMRGNVAFDDNVGAGTQRGVHGEGVSHDLGDGRTRNARTVWEIPTQPYPDAHFAVFPEELPRRCILAGCPEDGTVLDPFMGSGTTALVARKLGRKSVGIELNAEYAELAARRLQQLSLLA